MEEQKKRTKRKYEAGFELRIAKEVDAEPGKDYKPVAKRHQIPLTTALSWFMKYKTYGAQVFAKQDPRLGKPSPLTKRVNDLESRLKILEDLITK
jgi:hypothetical protein